MALNIYLIHEGVCDVAIYKSWVKLLNPSLSFVNDLDQVSHNHVYAFSSGGYPHYFRTIKAAIADVNEHKQFNRLVIAIDSEDMTYQEKLSEIQKHINDNPCNIQINIIIQHFCIETWLLGNKKIFSINSKRKELQELINHYNVAQNDPEMLPLITAPNSNLCGANRAQIAYQYLRMLINEKNRNLTYKKSTDSVNFVKHPKYFEQVKNRCLTDNHISSFKDFIRAFSDN